MSDERQSIAEIEAELERQRQALNANLSALKDRMTPGGLARDAMGLLNLPSPEAATGMAGSLAGTIRANPVAALIAGSGLMWLVSRPSRRRAVKGAPVKSRPSSLGTAVSAAAALANVVSALEPEEVRAVAAEVDRITRAGAAKVREFDESLRQSAGDLAETLREGSRAAKETASEKARVAKDAAAVAKAKIDGGVDSLKEGAAAASESALRTARRAKKKTDDALGDVAGLVERHPLAAGAGAVATGALIALLLGGGSDRGKGQRSG